MIKKSTYIDLFAGCGGLSLGLHNAGWQGLFAVEKNADAFMTLKHNLIENKDHFDWPEWLPQKENDINFILANYKHNLLKLRNQVDLVAGGPPCQGFSIAGRRNEDDIRNGLIKSYLKFILYVRPKLIFFENVRGFTQAFAKNKSKGKSYSTYVKKMLDRIGYDVEGDLIDFSQYGIPQKRTRFILVGVRKDISEQVNHKASSFFLLLKDNKFAFLESKELPQQPNLDDAISDLFKKNGLKETTDRKGFFSGIYSDPKSDYQKWLRKEFTNNNIPNSHSFPKHSQRIIERFIVFLKTHRTNKNISKEIRLKYQINKHVIIPLSGNLPAPTITTLPDDYIHYSEPRILTVREYARIQSFPDWYQFKGKYTTGGKRRKQEVPRYSQIGNAIPPLFGEQSGVVLLKLLCRKN